MDGTPSPMYFATNPPKRLHSARDALLIGRDNLAKIFRVHALPRGPLSSTKSEKITVTWRRSARSCGMRRLGHSAWALRQRRALCRPKQGDQTTEDV